MGVSRSELTAVGLAALVAAAMPALLLMPRAAPSAPAIRPAPLAVRAPGTPLAAIYGRALFGGADKVEEESDTPADAPVLVGIVGRIGSDAVAMVRGGDGTGRTLKIGESVDGWTLESLAIDAAFFTRGGQRVRMPLPAG